MKIIQECLIQSVSYLREKISYEEACKHSNSDIFKHNKIITTRKHYIFVRCKPRIAKKKYKNYEKITYSYDNCIYIVAYYNTQVSCEPEFQEEEEKNYELIVEYPKEMKHTIQSILIPRDHYSLDEAIEYIKERFKYKKVEITPKYYRFRQYQPKYLSTKLGLNNVMTLTKSKTGIKHIIFYTS